MRALRTRSLVAVVALALAACGGGEASTADSPAASGGAGTPPQPEGPMNMVDSATRAPQTADSLPPGAQPRDSARPDTTKRP